MDRITDRHDMTSAVDRGRKASTQTNKNSTEKLSFNSLKVFFFSRTDWNFYSKNAHTRKFQFNNRLEV